MQGSGQKENKSYLSPAKAGRAVACKLITSFFR